MKASQEYPKAYGVEIARQHLSHMVPGLQIRFTNTCLQVVILAFAFAIWWKIHIMILDI